MAQQGIVEDPRSRSLRTTALVVYGLYLASLFTAVTGLIGVIVAHLKRGEAAGTVWESHFDNQIRIFWVGLVVGFMGLALTLVLIGWLVLFGVFVWYLYRTVKGLLRAVDDRPCD